MAGNYCQEYNRTLPHQTEGPEYTPYINKGTVAEKPKASNVLAALLAAAAVLAALLLPLCFSVKNVLSRSAELHCEITEEQGFQETDSIVYQLLFRGDVIEEGDLSFGEQILPLEDLNPDSRYSIRIFQNEERIKTLSFRTRPEGTPPPADPVTPPAPPSAELPPQPPAPPAPPVETPVELPEEEPPEEEPPEEAPPEEDQEAPAEPPAQQPSTPSRPANFKPPVLLPLTLDTITAELTDSKNGANLSWSVTTNSSTNVRYSVYRKSTLVYSGTDTSCTVSRLAAGKHTFRIFAHHTFNGVSTSVYDTVTLTVPSGPKSLTFRTLTSTLTDDKTGTKLTWAVTVNDSKDVTYEVYQGNTLIHTGTETTHTVTGLAPGTYNFKVKARYTTGGTAGSAEKTVTVTIPATSVPLTFDRFEASPDGMTTYLYFTVTPNDSTDITYEVLQDGTSIYTGTEGEFQVPNLVPGEYSFEGIVRFKTKGEDGSLSQTIPVVIEAIPLSFDNLTAEMAGPHEALLNWYVTPNHSVVTGYDVYRNGELYESITDTSVTSFPMMDLSPGENTFAVTVHFTTLGVSGSERVDTTINVPEPPVYPDFDTGSLELLVDMTAPANPLLWLSIDVLPGDADPDSIEVTASAQGHSLTAELSPSDDRITALIQEQPFPVTSTGDTLTVTLTLQFTVAGLSDQISLDMPCDIVTE